MKNNKIIFSKATKVIKFAPILYSFLINGSYFVQVDFKPDCVRVSISRTTNSRVLRLRKNTIALLSPNVKTHKTR